MPPKKEDVTEIKDGDDFVVGDDDDKAGDDKLGDDKPTDLSETENLAIELGWNPDHEGEDAVDARTFILRSRDIQDTMRKTNKDSKRKIDTLQKGIKDIKDYYHKLDETRAEKMASEIIRLNDERYTAIEEGDVDKVKGLDKDIKAAEKEAEPIMDEDEDNPLFDEWATDNKWYGTDNEMTQYADEQAQLSKYKGVPYQRVLQMIEKSAKDIFPDKFESNGKPESKGKKETPVSKVEGTTQKNSKKAPSVSDLDAEQKEMMKNILSVDDSLTQKEYLKGLQEMGEI